MLTILLTMTPPEYQQLLTQFYKEHRALAQKIAYRFLGRSPHLEDAVQSAWLSAAQNAEKLFSFPPEKRAAYFVIIVKNKCRDILRREQKYVSLESGLFHTPDPSASDALHLDYRCAVDAIRALPDPYAAVLELRLVLGESNHETARRLGLSDSAASERYTKALAMVREALRKEGVTYE